MNTDGQIAEKVLRLRFGQMIINEKIKKREFRIPIHLALGHEAVAVAVDGILNPEDQLVLTHRNIHYNLVRSTSFKALVDEYALDSNGPANGRAGSMNLSNEAAGIVYTSSILGNNLSVACGLAMGNLFNGCKGVVFVVTGDGAMEEGAFYESLLFLNTFNLPVVIIVENNEWSLATQIHERRCPIELECLTRSFNMQYVHLTGNDPSKYIEELNGLRSHTLENKIPVLAEVGLSTLGDWRLKTEEFPDGKFVNYHAGASPSVTLEDDPLIAHDETDPVYVVAKKFEPGEFARKAAEILRGLYEEIG